MQKIFRALILLVMLGLTSIVHAGNSLPNTDNPMAEQQTATEKKIVRIAEIEVYPQYLDQYLTYAKEAADTSVREEPGVICIFPMQLKKQANTFRIVEIYRDETSYHSHLETPHFLRYKQGTLHMVKTLNLPDMQMVNPEGFSAIFKKAAE